VFGAKQQAYLLTRSPYSLVYLSVLFFPVFQTISTYVGSRHAELSRLSHAASPRSDNVVSASSVDSFWHHPKIFYVPAIFLLLLLSAHIAVVFISPLIG